MGIQRGGKLAGYRSGAAAALLLSWACVPPSQAQTTRDTRRPSTRPLEFPPPLRRVEPPGATLAVKQEMQQHNTAGLLLQVPSGSAVNPTTGAITVTRSDAANKLRSAMASVGIDDGATQDALLQYLAEDEQGRAVVRDAARKMVYALRRDAPPEKIQELLGTYKSALSQDRERRSQSQQALDEKIAFSSKPRLEAVLLLVGVLGDGQTMFPASALSRAWSTRNSAAATDRTAPSTETANPQNSNGTAGTTDSARLPAPEPPMQYPTGPNPPPQGEPDAQTATTPPPGAPGAGTPNTGAPNTGAPDASQKRPRHTGPQAQSLRGEVTGSVDNKGDDWIEVKDDAGNVERYMPAWVGGAQGGYDSRIIQTILAVQVGDKVSLKWVWGTRKVILALTPLTGKAVPAN